ncbi:MAG: Plastocyanin [Candidatus Kaiserbacteria bacterium]|nr:Plastocyanin [Candidatus Kaiserbacteria bacterium]
MTHRQELLLGIVAILILIAAIYLFGHPSQKIRARFNTKSIDLPVPTGPSATEAAQLKASTGFQELVSYTDGGFAPGKLSVKKGDTVRFTNSSKADLWVAATGASGSVYPGKTVDECGQSAFDSCRVIAPGGFWEFTFDTAGTWGYQNNRDTAMTGMIVIQ